MNTAAIAALLGAAAVGTAALPPAWLYPNATAPRAAPQAHDRAPRSLSGSKATFTAAQLGDLAHAVDWRPTEHPPMPALVAAGQGQGGACGYCHLPAGEGRPENAALAGLPADYIRRQAAAFADGHRGAAMSFVPSTLMAQTARASDPTAVAAAADYFSRIRFVSRVRVVEADRVPAFTAEHFVYRPMGGGTVVLGERIIEEPDSMERFELRDGHVGFTAYVPKGSIARGAGLAQPCASCHGAGLKGGLGPPLAGRSPTYIARQLYAFRLGARSEVEAAPMRATASGLSDRQIIDLAAYAANLKP